MKLLLMGFFLFIVSQNSFANTIFIKNYQTNLEFFKKANTTVEMSHFARKLSTFCHEELSRSISQYSKKANQKQFQSFKNDQAIWKKIHDLKIKKAASSLAKTGGTIAKAGLEIQRSNLLKQRILDVYKLLKEL